MKNAGRQYGVGTADLNAIGQMLQRTHSARCNHRDADRVAHRPRQFKIKAGLGAIAVHAGQQNFTSPATRHLGRPGHRIETGVLASTVAVNIPASTARSKVVALAAFGVNRHHDALGAVFARGVLNYLRIRDGGRIETGLVGACVEQAAYIFHRAHAAAHGKRNKHLGGHCLNDVQDQIPPVAGGGDVEKREFVGTLLVVTRRNFHRIAGIAQLDKVDAFDDPATGDVEAGNDSFG